jgi:hypothetical protein
LDPTLKETAGEYKERMRGMGRNPEEANGVPQQLQLSLLQELVEHCKGERTDTSRWHSEEYKASVTGGQQGGWDLVDMMNSQYLQNIAAHPIQMWQAKEEGVCEALFEGGLWGWAFDVHGHVSKTVWRSMLTDGLHKCKGDQADCGEVRAEGEVTPVLQAMHDFASAKQSEGRAGEATMQAFALHTRLSGTSCSSLPSAWSTAHTLFTREVFCHFQVSTSGVRPTRAANLPN